MTDLNFVIGFIIGSLFTIFLMFIIKKIFFNSPHFSDNNKINNQSSKPLEKQNNNNIFPETKNSKNELKENIKTNLESGNKINAN